MTVTYIVEGPDGSGKTSLVKELSHLYHTSPRPRHTNSTAGPQQGLWNWIVAERSLWLATNQVITARIYDRHPLIGEYIYGPILRGEVAKPFTSPTAKLLALEMFATCQVIVCLPPLEVVRANIWSSKQMEGIRGNIEEIYESYRQLAQHPRVLVWDYTSSLVVER